MQLTDELLHKCLQELRSQQRKYSVYERYYRGEHDILRNYSMQKSRSNMKVVVNFFRKFINDEISYSFGNPINYISRNNDHDLIDNIDLNFSHWEKVHNQKLALKTAIFGFAFELDYINQDNEFKSTVLTPLNCYVVENGNAEKNVVLALHTYKENKFSDNEMLDVYHENKIYTYSVSNNRLKYLTTRTHIFNNVPIRVNEYNNERQSMLDDIKTINDAYNNIISDLTNEVSDFRQAMLKITGAKLDIEEASKMKESGIVQVPDKADIDFLIKNINDVFVQNLLNTHEEKLYKLSSHVDTNEKLQSNLSGTALRSRMISLENKCSLLQALIESTIKKRLKNFFKFLKISEGKNYDYRSIKIKFTMNVPHDTNLIADSISKLKDTVSQRTLLSMLPNVENPDHEMAQFYKEQQEKRQMEMEGQIDLMRLGLDDNAISTLSDLDE